MAESQLRLMGSYLSRSVIVFQRNAALIPIKVPERSKKISFTLGILPGEKNCVASLVRAIPVATSTATVNISA